MAKRAGSSKSTLKRTASGTKAKKRASATKSKVRKTATTTAKASAKRRKTAKARTAGAVKTAKRASVASVGRSTAKKAKPAATPKRTAKVAPAKRTTRKKTTGATPTGGTPSSPAPDPIQIVEERRRPPKTHLTKKQLGKFQQLLLVKRSELAGDVERLTHDAFDPKGNIRGDQSSMPIHMADLGSDNWEKEFTLGLIENEQALIREIDAALVRIADRTYGVCLATYGKISLARLRAKPWAKYCIAYARAREEGRAP